MAIHASSQDFHEQFEYFETNPTLNEASEAALRRCFAIANGALEIWQGMPIESGPTDGIRCGIVGNARFNAAAKVHDDHEYVAVFGGAYVKALDCMLALLSTPMLFPMANGACEEANAPRVVGEHIRLTFSQNNDSLEWGRLIPLSEARRQVAHEYAFACTLPLIYHEIGHIVKGHLEYLGAEHGVSTLDELDESQDVPTSVSCLHALELDADITAAKRSFQQIAVTGEGFFPNTSFAERLVIWAAGSYIFFLLLDLAETSPTTKLSSTHPKALTRMANYFAAAKDEYRRCYFHLTQHDLVRKLYPLPLDDFDQIVQGTILHVKSVWDATGISARSFGDPVANAQHVKHSHQYLQMLIDFGLRDYMIRRGHRLGAKHRLQ